MAEGSPEFLGTHVHGIDDNGRMVLPAKIRAQLGETAILAKLDDCIGLFPKAEFRRVAARFEDALDEAEASGDDDQLFKALRAIRRFSGDAIEVTPDQQGRIVVPAVLREFADLQGELVTVGVLRRAEIWNRQRWEGDTDAADDDVRTTALRRGVTRGQRRDREPEAQ